LPILTAKLERAPLSTLHNATFTQQSTLYVPPLGAPRIDARRLAMLSSEQTKSA
jgi:hypothetical protein